MKILAVSDKVEEAIYSSQILDLYPDASLVIGCGDLPYYYLEYITTIMPCDVVYVYGNHDGIQHTADGRSLSKAEGCALIEGRSVMRQGLILVGLGGSIRYLPNAKNQYTEAQMWVRIIRLLPILLLNKLRYGRFLDVLVTHSPPFGIHDGHDRPHHGFKSFLTFMRYFKPKYLLHGHKHLHRRNIKEETAYYKTMVINVYPKYLLECDVNR